MKIFMSANNDLRYYGVHQALKTVVPTSFFWDKKALSVFDLLHDHKPDILMYGDADASDRSIELAQKDFPDTKFVFLQSMPSLSTAKPDAIVSLSDIINSNLKLDFCTNLVDMEGGQKTDKFTTQIVALTDNIDPDNKDILLTLRVLSDQFQTKIYGNNKVSVPNYLGRLRPSDYRHAFASAQIFVAFSKHRVHDAYFNGCTPMQYSTEKGALSFRNLSELLEKLPTAIIQSSLTCNDLYKLAMKTTYHHFLSDMFNSLGLNDLQDQTQQRIKEYDRHNSR